MPVALKKIFAQADNSLHAPRRIFWVALAVRLLYMTLAHTYRIRALDDHFEFGWEDGRIARALATGFGYADPFNGHSGPTAWTPPLFPLLLAGIFKVFGVYSKASAWVILAFDCVVSAATVPAIYEMARRSLPRMPGVALWSAWLWALYPAAMQYAVRWVWDTALSACLFAWVIVFALRVRGIGGERARGVAVWIGFGCLWGLIAVTTSSLLLFLPACGVWMLWGSVTPRSLAHAGAAALCFVVILAPWVVRNQRVFHHFVPMRANLGAELYQSVLLTNEASPWGGTVSLNPRSADWQRYRSMGELAYSKSQGARAVAIARAHPGRMLDFTLRRIDFFWFGVAHPTDKSLAGEILRRINFSLLSVGGLLGLALALRRRVPGAVLYALAFLLVPLIYYVVTVQARFRHPLEPLITILTVYLFQSAEPRRASPGHQSELKSGHGQPEGQAA